MIVLEKKLIGENYNVKFKTIKFNKEQYPQSFYDLLIMVRNRLKSTRAQMFKYLYSFDLGTHTLQYGSKKRLLK